MVRAIKQPYRYDTRYFDGFSSQLNKLLIHYLFIFYFYLFYLLGHLMLHLELHLQASQCGGLPSMLSGSAPAMLIHNFEAILQEFLLVQVSPNQQKDLIFREVLLNF